MSELEKVERLREHANVTFEEAKMVLEKNQWDLLEAMVDLERQGKVKQPNATSYTTQYEEPEKIEKIRAWGKEHAISASKKSSI